MRNEATVKLQALRAESACAVTVRAYSPLVLFPSPMVLVHCLKVYQNGTRATRSNGRDFSRNSQC